MRLNDGVLLFHGSYTSVENIDLNACAQGKDFGRGFYLTSNLPQAKSFIRSSVLKAQNNGLIPTDRTYGFVSSYRYHEPKDKLFVYDFPEADKNWLWFVSLNRRKKLAEALKEYLDEAAFSADIVSGKIANDTTNPVIAAYLNGLYGDIKSDRAVAFAIEQLMPEHLVDQFCFSSEKAIKCLEFVEARQYGF